MNTILSRHIHMPKARPPQHHRLVALDSTHLRCLDCQQTLDLSSPLGARPSSVRPTSTSTPAAPRDPKPDETCPRHPGEFRTACRSCAADRLERQPNDPPPVSQVRTGADPTQIPEWQQARERLAARQAARRREQREADLASAELPLTDPDPTIEPDQPTEPSEGTA